MVILRANEDQVAGTERLSLSVHMMNTFPLFDPHYLGKIVTVVGNRHSAVIQGQRQMKRTPGFDKVFPTASHIKEVYKYVSMAEEKSAESSYKQKDA